MIVGIDLGTTFSLVGYVNEKGTPVLCPSPGAGPRKFQTPSVSHIGPRGCLVGDIVETLLEEDPAMPVCRFAKLAMGTAKTIYTDHDGFPYGPEAMSALVLRKLKADAENTFNEKITGAVITIPAHFNEAERKATVDAGRLADLPVLGLVEEPLAAATYFGLDTRAGEKTIFVFDLGGGTLDATILQATPEGLYAIATEGANNIGGKNFDEAIMDIVLEQYEGQYRASLQNDRESLQKIRAFATAAKIELSQPDKTSLTKPLLLARRPLTVTLTRGQFEALCEPWLEASELVCKAALRAASMKWGDIDDLVLTGGSSLVPCIERKVRAMSGLPQNNVRRQQPHASVAYGAALLAEQLHGKRETLAPPLRQTVTSNELGIRVHDPEKNKSVFHAMIEKNVPLPVKFRQTVYTRNDAQKTVSVDILQRKDEYSAAESLGAFTFGPIRHPERNYPVEIEMGYDESGRVTVTAKDCRTGEAIAREFSGQNERDLTQAYQRLKTLAILA